MGLTLVEAISRRRLTRKTRNERKTQTAPARVMLWQRFSWAGRSGLFDMVNIWGGLLKMPDRYICAIGPPRKQAQSLQQRVFPPCVEPDNEVVKIAFQEPIDDR